MTGPVLVQGAGSGADELAATLLSWNLDVRRHAVPKEKLGAIILVLDELARPEDLAKPVLTAATSLRDLAPNARVITVSRTAADARPGRCRPGRRGGPPGSGRTPPLARQGAPRRCHRQRHPARRRRRHHQPQHPRRAPVLPLRPFRVRRRPVPHRRLRRRPPAGRRREAAGGQGRRRDRCGARHRRRDRTHPATATAPRSSSSISRRPGTTSRRWPTRCTAPPCSWTSAVRTPGSGSSTTPWNATVAWTS